MSRRTILFVDASPAVGGATRVLLDLLAALDPGKAEGIVACRAGTSVEKVLRERGVAVEPMELPVLTFAGGPAAWGRMAARTMASGRALSRLLRERRPALVHGSGLASTLLAALPAMRAGVPLVWHAHDNLENRARNVPAVRAAAAASRAIVCVSEAVRARLVEMGVDPGKCAVVHNAVPGPLRPQAEAGSHAKPAVPRLLAVGTLTPQKGHHVLVEAAARLVERHPDLEVLVAGEVTVEGDRGYLRGLEADVERRGLSGRFRFLGYREDVPELIRDATVVVQPSISDETFGLVALEAMAAGRPVVATRVGGLVEVVEDGVCGRLVEPGDAERLAAAVHELLASPDLRGRFGEAGRRIAAERFGQAAMRGRLDAVLAGILGAPVLRAAE